ncbi:MAG: hybrid sensor histidine kinase/response regulator [Marinilabiliaceae bacterium]|nr:hybrid sensor histidine kinase/response regulator [Marinilabiliaceae bacterium]
MNNKILIVDDHGKNIQLLANLLTSAHYDIEYALNGKTAIQWIEKEDFDLVLMDIMMPEMDGFETCIKIKQIPGKNEIPIVFITARDDTESITKAFNAGGVDYLTKPFNQEELLVRIATHVELKHNREKLLDTTKWLEKEVDKKTLELQKANQKLESAYSNLKTLDQAQNEFLKSISHEIRTPLNGIVGSLGLLKSFENTPDVDEIIKLLEKSVEKLEKYSYSALQIAFVRLKGLDENNLQDININAVMKSVVNRCIERCDKKNEYRYKSNKVGLKIFGDFDLINSAFQALLESSSAFTSSGIIDVTITDHEEYVICEIEDTGSLFAAQNPAYMFDSLFSKGGKYERNTSLELHLAQMIVLSHKGNIRFVNRDDKKGTVTTVEFPKDFRHITSY